MDVAPATASSAGCPLVFDVLGSLLDEDAGRRRAVERALDAPAEQVEHFVQAWSTGFEQLLAPIAAGEQPYRNSEDLHAQAALDAARDIDIAMSSDAAHELARFGRSLEPFDDVPSALEALARVHPLVALTNATSAQAFAMSRHAGLRWTTLLSGEVVRAYKPNPRMYEYAVRALEIDPRASIFVAAHPWDLDAAAEHGFRTAYLDRSGSGESARYDFAAADLAALVPQLPG